MTRYVRTLKIGYIVCISVKFLVEREPLPGVLFDGFAAYLERRFRFHVWFIPHTRFDVAPMFET
jgi:hypothetical protein